MNAASLDTAERAHVAEAWRFRWQVEREAEARFLRLAGRLARVGAAAELQEMARSASADERRHVGLCAELAEGYGAVLDPHALAEPGEVAPAGLSEPDRVLYEVVAACCITETESCGVLTTLLAGEMLPRVKEIVHEIARDEVTHARLGWAHLAAEAARRDVRALADWVPMMLQGTAPADLFAAGATAAGSPRLLAHGVLPHAEKRRVFESMLAEVVFPGLESFDIDTAPSRAWLARRSAGAVG